MGSRMIWGFAVVPEDELRRRASAGRPGGGDRAGATPQAMRDTLRPMSRIAGRRSTATILALGIMAGLAACAPIVPLVPTDGAADPACAEVTVRLPDSVAGLDSRQTDAQATGAWGTPATVILYCGLEPPPPTSTQPCVSAGGVDWLLDDSDDPTFVFTTYGRVPAVQVIIDSDGDPDVDDDGVSGVAALTELGPAVATLPAEGACISPQDAEN